MLSNMMFNLICSRFRGGRSIHNNNGPTGQSDASHDATLMVIQHINSLEGLEDSEEDG